MWTLRSLTRRRSLVIRRLDRLIDLLEEQNALLARSQGLTRNRPGNRQSPEASQTPPDLQAPPSRRRSASDVFISRLPTPLELELQEIQRRSAAAGVVTQASPVDPEDPAPSTEPQASSSDVRPAPSSAPPASASTRPKTSHVN